MKCEVSMQTKFNLDDILNETEDFLREASTSRAFDSEESINNDELTEEENAEVVAQYFEDALEEDAVRNDKLAA